MKPINVVNPYQNLTISNGKPLETSNISDIWDAISYALKDGNDKISDEIVKKLAENHNFKEWMNLLPKSTPSIFEWYKNDFSRNNPNTYQKLNDVDLEIKKSGICLPIGQQLFRGGIGWIEDNNTAITTNPISTSFSPKIALLFANKPKNWCGNRINLFLLTIKEDGIKAFPYSLTCERYIESEVLIQAGIKLTLVNDTLVKKDFKANMTNPNNRSEIISKNFEVHVVEFDVTKE